MDSFVQRTTKSVKPMDDDQFTKVIGHLRTLFLIAFLISTQDIAFCSVEAIAKFLVALGFNAPNFFINHQSISEVIQVLIVLLKLPKKYIHLDLTCRDF